MAARLRHIALSVSDPEKAAKFFEDAFGMTRVGKAGIGCYVSDGTINVALLKYDGEVPGFHKGYHGIVHFAAPIDPIVLRAWQAWRAGNLAATVRDINAISSTERLNAVSLDYLCVEPACGGVSRPFGEGHRTIPSWRRDGHCRTHRHAKAV